MPWSSNATFLVNLCVDGQPWGRPSTSRCAASGRCGTSSPACTGASCAAYLLSEAMGTRHLVPPTIIRDGPQGEGSVQWFVEADHQQHYFTIYENRDRPARRVARRSRCSTSSPTTPTARAATCSSTPTITCGASTTASASPPSSSCAPSCGSSVASRSPTHLLAVAERAGRAACPLDVAALLNDDEVEAMQERAQWIVEHRCSRWTTAAAATPGRWSDPRPDGRARRKRRKAALAGRLVPFRCCSVSRELCSASISFGSTLWTSPTMPRSAMPKMGASLSLLMAMMFFEPFMPTMCWVAPEMPAAMYTPGFTTLPVWPTW